MAFIDRVRFADDLAQMRGVQVVHQQVERDITFIERCIGILGPVGGHVEERGEHATVNLPERVMMALRNLKIDARIPWLDCNHIHVDQVIERALGQELHDRLCVSRIELLSDLVGVFHDAFFLEMQCERLQTRGHSIRWYTTLPYYRFDTTSRLCVPILARRLR